MKNLIKILAVFALFALTDTAQAQVRGTFGTYTGFTQSTMSSWYSDGTAAKVNKDTLTGTDTGYVWISVTNNEDLQFDMLTTVITGTVSATSLVLYGNNDSAELTGTNWQAITGSVVYCASCIGATSTTTPAAGPGTKHYIWYIPHSGVLFRHYMIRLIQGGTYTATYQGTVTYRY